MNQSHAVYVKYLGPTNYRDSRVKLFTYDISANERPSTITMDYDHEVSSPLEQAIKLLKSVGFEHFVINGRHPYHYVIMCEWNHSKLLQAFIKGGRRE